MGSNTFITFTAIYSLLAGVGFFALSDDRPQVETHLNYVVHARSTEAAIAAVQAVGGDVLDTIGTMHAVGAALTPREVATLRAADSIRVYARSGAGSARGTH
jgi:predicted enzyme related to lactoylglutathione lyase